jgi:D-cysteine desulfhydrase family pyridoxal phosphate-dependent enzyme
MVPVSSQASLSARLDAYPRVALATYPTPLEHLPRLSRELGRAVYIKRDDQIGPGLGGNKTRKLEYLLAEAQQTGARRIATFGGLQSNHARLTAAAARLCGLETHLFYFTRRPHLLEGNLLLNQFLGAQMHFLPLGAGSDGNMTIETAIRLAHLAITARIGPHYYIPVGGHNWLGALGYVRAAVEMDEQARSLGIPEARVIVAAGSGGTLAGLLAGFVLANSGLRPLGIDVGRLWRGFAGSIARLASEICTHLDVPRTFTQAQVPLIEGSYIGSGYGIPSPGGQAAIRQLAQSEGIFLDPVYTGKAFAGLLDLAGHQALGRDDPLIFLHTGGSPALFAFTGAGHPPQP